MRFLSFLSITAALAMASVLQVQGIVPSTQCSSPSQSVIQASATQQGQAGSGEEFDFEILIQPETRPGDLHGAVIVQEIENAQNQGLMFWKIEKPACDVLINPPAYFACGNLNALQDGPWEGKMAIPTMVRLGTFIPDGGMVMISRIKVMTAYGGVVLCTEATTIATGL